jgi:hypothetical protein
MKVNRDKYLYLLSETGGDMEAPQEVINYEIWRETRDEFDEKIDELLVVPELTDLDPEKNWLLMGKAEPEKGIIDFEVEARLENGPLPQYNFIKYKNNGDDVNQGDLIGTCIPRGEYAQIQPPPDEQKIISPWKGKIKYADWIEWGQIWLQNSSEEASKTVEIAEIDKANPDPWDYKTSYEWKNNLSIEEISGLIEPPDTTDMADGDSAALCFVKDLTEPNNGHFEWKVVVDKVI